MSGGRHDVPQRVAKRLPVPVQRRVDQDHAGHVRHHVHERRGDAPRAADPSEVRVEHHEHDEPQPEVRQRVAHEAEEPHGVIRGAALPYRGCDSQRHAEQHAGNQREGGQLERGGEDALDVLDHRMPGRDRRAEISCRDVAHVIGELHRQRLVQAQPRVNLAIGLLVRLVAHGATTGSTGITRPMKKVSAASPRSVAATVPARPAARSALPRGSALLDARIVVPGHRALEGAHVAADDVHVEPLEQVDDG
jgi:hypothetical protein